MKIAFLISAYKDPAQLRNLIDALKGDGSYFFIHIDKKVDINLFKAVIPEFKLDNQSLLYTQIRYYVYWGGWNQVRYQKELLRSCFELDIDFDRIVLITGQDFPLVSREKLFEKYISNFDGKNYLRIKDFIEKKYQIKKRRLNCRKGS